MKELCIKKYWEDEDILIFLHFKDDFAIRQIEVSSSKVVYLDEIHPLEGESMLCDQAILFFDYTENDVISKQEFELYWEKRW